MQLLIQLVREILYLSGKSPLAAVREFQKLLAVTTMFYHVMKVKWFFEFIQCIRNRDGIRSIERPLTKFTVLLFLLTAVIKKWEWVLNRLVCKRGCWTWNKMIPNPKHLQAVIHCLVLYQLCTICTAVDKLFLSYSRFSSYSHISIIYECQCI